MIKIFATRMIALSAVVICGCSNTVLPLDVEFPTPLIEPLPITIGLYYDDDLRNFIYNETVSDGTTWQIQLGQNNTRLFDRLFGAMFSKVVVVDDLENGPAALDGIIHPVLEEYAFLTPRELGSSFYAVSIRYRVFLYDRDGNELAAWPINAYGQSESGTRTNGIKASPLQEATNLAMRDAAAGAIMTFPSQPEIIGLIDQEESDVEVDESN